MKTFNKVTNVIAQVAIQTVSFTTETISTLGTLATAGGNLGSAALQTLSTATRHKLVPESKWNECFPHQSIGKNFQDYNDISATKLGVLDGRNSMSQLTAHYISMVITE